MKKILANIIFIIIIISQPLFAGDFEDLVKELNKEGCHYFEFLSIIESDIFETIDTTNGSLYLSGDGRFRVEIGTDLYIADSVKLYSYSEENNQVVIEPRTSGDDDQFSFISNFDIFYSSNRGDKDFEYMLIKKDNIINDHSDSLIITLDPTHNILKQMEYFDVNEDLNRIIFLKQDHGISCDQTKFEADFPDTVEKVRL